MFELLSIYIFSIILTNLILPLDSSPSLISSKDAMGDKESFRDWEHWKERYPQCNPEHNPNTSPIAITSENINPTPHLKAIFVNSKIPVDDCLTLSILYKDGDLEMEAITINALPSCEKQLTQISGGGERISNIRNFKRAVFFFTNTPLEEERSLHQINGKEFQMEIMMEFEDKNGNDYTQIFALVEAKLPTLAPTNPIFSVLESALFDLKEEIINEASGETSRALKFKELQTACHNNEQKYLESQEETKNILAVGRLEKIEKLVRDINGITNIDLIKLAENDKAQKNEPEMDSREEKLEELREQRSNLLEMMEEEKDANAMNELRELFKHVQVAIKKLEGQMGLGARGREKLTLESMKKLLRANKVGVPGESAFPGMLYNTPDAVHKELLDIQRNISDYINKKRLYDKSCKEFSAFQKMPYAFVKINEPFQISWLFPQTGGYYIYQGSNPIPKCEERDITIVFEEPLIISTEQLSIFQNLPSLEALRSREDAKNSNRNATIENNLKVDKMIPVLANPEVNRMVWYVAKRPVFLGEDGFHMRSSLVKEQTTKESGKVGMIGNQWIFAFILLFNYCIV